MEDIIRFKCVKEFGKLRIKIISQGYNKYANCQFPKNIRKENAIYEAPASAVSFNRNSNVQFFYKVKKNFIKIVENPKVEIPDDFHIYSEPECVICLCEIPNLTFIPCGHNISCKDCFTKLPKKICPICRTHIEDVVSNEDIIN